MSTTPSSLPHVTRRQLLVGGVAAAGLPLALAACSSDGGSGGSDATLRGAWWGGAARHEKMKAIFDLFATQHDYAQVQTEFAEYGAYWERFATQAAGRNLPDVFGMTEQQVGDYGEALRDLQPYVDDGALDLSGYGQQFIDAGVVDGRLLMLFLGGTIPCIAYNSARLEAAGVTGDPGEWDWSQFHDAAVAVSASASSDHWGVDDGGGNVSLFDTFLRQHGKSVFSEDAIDHEQGDVEHWLTLWKELREDGGAPPYDVTSEYDGAPMTDTLFARGEVALSGRNHNHIPIIQPVIDDQLGYARFPLVDGGGPAAIVMGTYFSVADSAESDLAIEFLDFFANDTEAIALFEAEFGSLPSAAQREVVVGKVDEVMARSLEFGESVEDFSQIARPRPQGAVEATALFQAANESVALGESPADAAAAFYEQAVALTS